MKVERRVHSGVLLLKEGIEQMFMGQFRHTLDDKGRLTIPARYRDLLMGGAYVTQGFDGNLIVYPVPVFQAISQRVSKLTVTDPETRNLRRMLYSSGEQVDVDRAGRILIASFLRDLAKLKSEVVVVGSGDYFELWSPEAWEVQFAGLQDLEANAKRFATFDLSSG